MQESTKDIKCPLYGSEPCEDCRITITCNNGGSITTETPLKEALARFQQRPESVDVKILKAIKEYYSEGKDSCCGCISCLDKQKVLNVINHIEKELKE